MVMLLNFLVPLHLRVVRPHRLTRALLARWLRLAARAAGLQVRAWVRVWVRVRVPSPYPNPDPNPNLSLRVSPNPGKHLLGLG